MKLDEEHILAMTKRQESILILDENGNDLDRAFRSLTAEIPAAHIAIANSVEQCRKRLSEVNFDVVVLDRHLTNTDPIELIHELKLRDYEPALLVVSSGSDTREIAQVFNSGCERFILKEGEWIDELAPAVRQVLRLKRLEEENRSLMARLTEANQLLEDKNHRLDEFCATVAHDIRGPLAGIVMKLEFIRDLYGDIGDDRFKQVLKSAQSSSERLTSVLQSMYNLAKLGEQAAFMSEVSLDSLLEAVVADLPFDSSMDIEITIGDLPQVWGNQALLSRVFMNLITNAIKYNDKPVKKVNIGIDRIEKSSFGPFCYIFVDDNGNGIDPNELGDIFSMFRRGARNRTESDGSGIGLSVVRRIIELHYGTVQVSSEPGKGSRFLLSLPIERLALFTPPK